MTSEDKLMRYIKYLPLELENIIKNYIPISILKRVRKIKDNELPRNYRIAKALNEHFYMTSTGYNLDILTCNTNIKYLERRLIHLNRQFNDTFNIHECYQITNNKLITQTSIKNKQKSSLFATILYCLHKEYHDTSSDQLQSYNIIEV